MIEKFHEEIETINKWHNCELVERTDTFAKFTWQNRVSYTYAYLEELSELLKSYDSTIVAQYETEISGTFHHNTIAVLYSYSDDVKIRLGFHLEEDRIFTSHYLLDEYNFSMSTWINKNEPDFLKFEKIQKAVMDYIINSNRYRLLHLTGLLEITL